MFGINNAASVILYFIIIQSNLTVENGSRTGAVVIELRLLPTANPGNKEQVRRL